MVRRSTAIAIALALLLPRAASAEAPVCTIPSVGSHPGFHEGTVGKLVIKHNPDPSRNVLKLTMAKVQALREDASVGLPDIQATGYRLCGWADGTLVYDVSVPPTVELVDEVNLWTTKSTSTKEIAKFADKKGAAWATTNGTKKLSVTMSTNPEKDTSKIQILLGGTAMPTVTPIGLELIPIATELRFELYNDASPTPLVAAFGFDPSMIKKNTYDPTKDKALLKASDKNGGVPPLPGPPVIVAQDGIGPDSSSTDGATSAYATSGITSSPPGIVTYDVEMIGDGTTQFQSFDFVGAGSGSGAFASAPSYHTYIWQFFVWSSRAAASDHPFSPDQLVIVSPSDMTVTPEWGTFAGVFDTELVEFDLTGYGIDCTAPGCVLGVYAEQPVAVEDFESWGIAETSLPRPTDIRYSTATVGGAPITPRGVRID